MRYQNGFLISFPDDLLEKIKSRLKMFVIMSDVVIEDLTSNHLFQIGLIDEKQSDAYILNTNLSIEISDTLDKDSDQFWGYRRVE